jgi:hypothetical protein
MIYIISNELQSTEPVERGVTNEDVKMAPAAFAAGLPQDFLKL